MSRYIPGTAEGDLLIAQAIAGAAEAEVAKQLRHYLPEATYAAVVSLDGTARTVTVDLYGRSEYRVTVPIIGAMPEAAGDQVQVQLLPNGQSYAQPVGGGILSGGGVTTPDPVPDETTPVPDQALPLAVYPTPNTLGLYTGQWSQIAEGSLQRFGNVSATATIGGNGPYTAGAPRGFLRFNIAQPDALGSVPLVSLELVHGAIVVAADLVLVTTAVNTSETEYQIHARVTGRDRFLSFLPLITHQHHAQHEWMGCSDFAVSLPAGTQYAAVAV